MRFEIRLFAVARERAGTGVLEIDLPEPLTVRHLRCVLAQSCPALAELLTRVRIAVDSDFADDDLVIHPGAEIAVIPPVSGGSS